MTQQHSNLSLLSLFFLLSLLQHSLPYLLLRYYYYISPNKMLITTTIIKTKKDTK
jgi:hypothetical protein